MMATKPRGWATLAACACVVASCTSPPRVAQPAPVPVELNTLVTDTMTLVLMGTTDVHGRIVNHDYYTNRATDHGLAVLKPVIDSIRAVHGARALLFDSGDLLQGNPLGQVHARQFPTQPSPIVHGMNLLHYDAAAIGNHEYNYGLAHLQRAVEQAEFPFLSANTFRAGTSQHAFTPYVILKVAAAGGDTVHVGVTGNTPPGVHVWDRDNVAGVLELRDVVASVRDVVTRMKADGADMVVVLSHGGFGGTSYDMATTGLPPENQAAEMAQQVPGIDVIFMGHTHREVADTTINGVLLSQAKNWGGSVAVATLGVEQRGDGEWAVTSRRGEIVRPARAPDRAFIDSVRWQHERTVAHVNSRIGRATAAMPAREARVRDVAIIDFINEVQRAAAGTQLSSTAAFSIGAALPAGEITIANVAALYPYDNTLKAIRITGAQLRAYLEKSASYYRGWPVTGGGTVTDFAVPGYNFDIVSGVDYTLDLSRPVGSRVTDLRFEGAPVRDDQSFTMALNNYRQAGGGGFDMIAGAPVVYDRQEDIRELIIEEVRRRGRVDPQAFFRESWRLAPAAAAAAALREQTQREAPAAGAGAGAAAATVDGAGAGAAAGTDQARKRLRVLSTNDFHGHLETQKPSWAEGREVGGAPVLASYFRLEADGFQGPTLLLDGGDVMQGTPVSNLTGGRSTVDYYNLVEYAGAAIGNHEFDWGSPVLRERIEQAKFPWLAANIYVADADTAPSWIRGTALIEHEGVRVGLIGLATEETPGTTMARNVAGLRFMEGGAIIDRHVPLLRAAGADFVIVVAHAGAECEDDAVTCEGELIDWVSRVRNKPDLVIGGHTNAVMRTRVNGIAVMESANWGLRYGVADLERVSADSVDVWMRGTPATWADVLPRDSAVARLVRAAEEEIGPEVERRISVAAEAIERGDGALGQLIADAQRARTGTQLAIMNNGGIRAPLAEGPLTWGDLYRVHPFANTLVTLRMRGADVREVFEHAIRNARPDAFISGAVVRYDSSRPAGSRIQSITLANGEPLRDDGEYTITANDFMANGVGDGYAAFTRALSQTPTGIVDLDALIAHVETMPQPIRAPREPRWVDVNARD